MKQSYDKNQLISVMTTALRLMDPRLVDHGERVAYIALEIFNFGDLGSIEERDKLFLLCNFHDIGAYKTEDIDHLLKFESEDMWDHSIYGYLFLKYMTSIGEDAQVFLYHHLDYKFYDSIDEKYRLFSALIHLADRIDILCLAQKPNYELLKDHGFDPYLLSLFFKADKDGHITQNVKNGTGAKISSDYGSSLNLTTKKAMEYIKMMVFSIDFRSEYTVTHTMSTTTISVELAKRLGISEKDQEKLYLGALLHDLGKIGIPVAILEYPGRISEKEMEIMRTHVEITEDIIKGLVSDEICKIAARHHEKPDGTGYPHHLKAEDMTCLEKIVAVADVTSALTGQRSYKEAYSKEKTLTILSQLQSYNQLDYDITQVIIDDFDQIMKKVDKAQQPLIKAHDNIKNEYRKLQLLTKQIG